MSPVELRVTRIPIKELIKGKKLFSMMMCVIYTFIDIQFIVHLCLDNLRNITINLVLTNN